MTEQLHTPKTVEQLHDASKETHAELTAFMAEAHVNEPAEPRGLFTRLPGREIGATEFVDKGCRGGWTVAYTTGLGNEPLRVTSVEKCRGERIALTLNVPGHNTQPVMVSLEEAMAMEFLRDDEPFDASIDVEFKAILTEQPFATLEGGPQGSNWREFLRVRAKSPLTHPVASPREPSFYRDSQFTPLDGAFERVDAYFDAATQQVLAQVTVSTDRRGKPVATPWTPLDTLEFYLEEVLETYAIERALAKAAEGLLDGQTTHSEHINGLLRATELPISYPLPVEADSERRGPHKASFVLGTIAADQTLKQLHVPTIESDDIFMAPYLRANRVNIYSERPWVVDDTTSLATPLLSPIFAAKQYRWRAVPIEQVIAPEQVVLPEQS